jgi:hypothetical protein
VLTNPGSFTASAHNTQHPHEKASKSERVVLPLVRFFGSSVLASKPPASTTTMVAVAAATRKEEP